MRSREKMAVVDAILMRAADQIGDLTPPVIDTYFKICPEARALFEYHGLGNTEGLEGQMVEQALYCLMYWFESPGEIEILLLGSVPHHNDTLKVSPNCYRELINATASVVAATIPTTHRREIEVWEELRRDLAGLIDRSGACV